MYSVAKFFYAMITIVPYIYVPHMMSSQKISPAYGSMAMSVLAVSNGVGRLLSGLFTKYSQYALVIQGAACSVSTICLFILPHCSSTIQFCIVTGIYGISIAPLLVLNSTILVNIVGMNGLSTAYGIDETIYGAGAIMGPTLIGIAVDYFGSYNVPFYLAGGCFGIAVTMSFITSKQLSKLSSKVYPKP